MEGVWFFASTKVGREPSKYMRASYQAVLLFLFFTNRVVAQQPLFRVIDIDVGATEHVRLSDGKHATVKLLSIGETRDKARSAIREARAEVEIHGSRAALFCGNYRLPVTLGEVQVDCTVTKAYYQNTDHDHWGVEKDARLRLWPAGSPFMPANSMVYPVRQRWFASRTQMANEPTYVDEGERISSAKIYYHAGLDIGGPRAWWMYSPPQMASWSVSGPRWLIERKQFQPRPPIQRHDLGAGWAALVPSLYAPLFV